MAMYCLDALKLFEKAGCAKAGAVAMETAQLGLGGLDINNLAPKYTLKSLLGSFSGSRLVSLMYAGFEMLAPDADGGIDLSREYGEAKRLLELERGPS